MWLAAHSGWLRSRLNSDPLLFLVAASVSTTIHSQPKGSIQKIPLGKEGLVIILALLFSPETKSYWFYFLSYPNFSLLLLPLLPTQPKPEPFKTQIGLCHLSAQYPLHPPPRLPISLSEIQCLHHSPRSNIWLYHLLFFSSSLCSSHPSLLAKYFLPQGLCTSYSLCP